MKEALKVVLLLRESDVAGEDLGRLLRAVGLVVVSIRSDDELLRVSREDVDLIILSAPPERPARDALVRRLKTTPALSDVPVLSLHEAGPPEPRDVLFDALGDGVALLDGNGTVVRCNRAMAGLLGLEADKAIGGDFFAMAAGLTIRRGDLPGSSRREVVEWTRGDRDFRVTAAPLASSGFGEARLGLGHILVVVTDITELHHLSERASEAAPAKVAAEARIEQLERDARLLQQFTAQSQARGVTLPQGAQPLRSSNPEVFCELIIAYEDLLERVIDRLTYRVSDPLSGTLRELAARLGRLGAGPRDVIELHGTALRNKSVGMPSSQARALADEGRLLVLELMGHLVSHYRHTGGESAGPPSTGNRPGVEGQADGRHVPDQTLRDGSNASITGGDRQSSPDLRGRA